MPKVTKEYFEKKKEKIITACYKVCLRKTMSTITMQDVIKESGLSQGGIYRFYSDVDKIITDVLIMIREKIDFHNEIDEIISRDKESLQILSDLFDLISEIMENNINTYCKIDYEMSVFATNYPKRVEKIMNDINTECSKEYLQKQVYILLKKYDGSHNKKSSNISIDDVISFISSSYDGIQIQAILSNCYGRSSNNPLLKLVNVKKLFNMLEKSVVNMMEEIYE